MSATPPKDHYQLFGISPHASEAEILNAYRKMVLKYHPDRHPEYPLAEERFKYINTAYQVLSNPATRAVYDEMVGYPQTPKIDTDAIWVLGILAVVMFLIVTGFVLLFNPSTFARPASTSPGYLYPTPRATSPVLPIPTQMPTATFVPTPTRRPMPTVIEGPIQDIHIPQKSMLAGAEHFCMLTSAGGIKCWGNNQYGQLGDGSKLNRSTPVDVPGLTNGVISLAGGQSNTCAFLQTGGLKCWGATDDATLANIAALNTSIVSMVSGTSHTCILTNRGAVQCWGSNFAQQLGNTYVMSNYSSAPIYVDGLYADVIAISAGGNHTCALLNTGYVKCWGENTAPADVNGLGGNIIAIAAGDIHTCALTSTGIVKCWGSNIVGQLGNDDLKQTSTPSDVVSLDGDVQSIEANGYSTCAKMKTGHLKCWGFISRLVEPANSGFPLVDVTEWAALSEDIQSIALGHSATCLRLSGDQVKCWGSNVRGQLGNGTIRYSPTLLDVQILAP